MGGIKGIALGALNYRMGGQLSSLISLAEGLQAAGIKARVLLPRGVSDFSKAALTRFTRQSLPFRLKAIGSMIYEQGRRDDELFHLMLPTPGFAGMARAFGLRKERTLLQWEGRPLVFDRETLCAAKDDPVYFLPRLLLNHQCLHVIARLCRYHQLVTTPYFAAWLKHRGHRKVSCITNLALLDRDDLESPGGELQSFLADPTPLVGYIGHAHPVKGVGDLLDAFLSAQACRPELRLLLALSMDGNGRALAQRREMLPASVRSRILITGTVPVGTVLGRLDALALPYRTIISTTLVPSLLLEADLARCPVILSDLHDFAEIVPRTGTGWHLVPPANIEMLAKAMVALPIRQATTELNVSPAATRIAQLIELYAQVGRVESGDLYG